MPRATSTQFSPRLQPWQFARICQLLYQVCGITLGPGKEELVGSRLQKRLHALRLDDYAAYLRYIQEDTSGQELVTMIDVLTTNKTSFFREQEHFTYVQRAILPTLLQSETPVRFWSAGCSSGEEPYSLAIVLREAIADLDRRDVRILATDISTRILAQARQAVYEHDILGDVPAPLLQKYFSAIRHASAPAYEVCSSVRALVRFARLNLMQAWPMRGPFDAIFCRNVMIYFDRPTREKLVQRYWTLLRPRGHLLIGHAESLSGVAHDFHYVRPAVYQKGL